MSISKKTVSSVATAVMAVSGIVLSIDSANADPGSPGCATRPEYREVKKGMKVARVQHIVGDSGRVTYRYLTPDYSHITRSFDICDGDGSMDVEFYKYSPRQVFKEEDKGWYQY